MVLIALPAGAAVAGVVGLFVAIPVVAFVTAVWGSVVAILEPEENSVANIGIVPGWLDRVAQWSWRLLIGAALLAFAIWLAVMLPLVVMPVVLAVVLAATFAPMVGGLLRRGWGRGRAALTVTAGAFLIITAIMVLTSVVLVEQLQPIVAQAAAGATKIDTATNGALSSLSSTTNEATGSVVAVARSFSSGIAALTIVLVLATLLTFYFLRDGGVAWADWLQRLASWRRTEVDAAGRRAAGVLGGYMIGTGAISLFAAATQWFIMVLLGLPLALPLAVLAFFLGFIPYIGSIVATGLAFLVTIAVGSTQDIAIMAVFTIVFNIVQGNVVAPLVYGKAVNLHPAIVLMAIPAGAALAGIVGMFLAVPFIGVIAATWRTVLRLFGERPGDAAAEPMPVVAPTSPPTADAPAPS